VLESVPPTARLPSLLARNLAFSTEEPRAREELALHAASAGRGKGTLRRLLLRNGRVYQPLFSVGRVEPSGEKLAHRRERSGDRNTPQQVDGSWISSWRILARTALIKTSKPSLRRSTLLPELGPSVEPLCLQGGTRERTAGKAHGRLILCDKFYGSLLRNPQLLLRGPPLGYPQFWDPGGSSTAARARARHSGSNNSRFRGVAGAGTGLHSRALPRHRSQRVSSGCDRGPRAEAKPAPGGTAGANLHAPASLGNQARRKAELRPKRRPEGSRETDSRMLGPTAEITHAACTAKSRSGAGLRGIAQAARQSLRMSMHQKRTLVGRPAARGRESIPGRKRKPWIRGDGQGTTDFRSACNPLSSRRHDKQRRNKQW